MSQIGDGGFADRLYEQLEPFHQGDVNLNLWVLCDGIGAMFETVEALTADRDDGLAGYANLLDVNNCDTDKLNYLGQFVGVRLRPDYDDAQQRAWIQERRISKRGRPASIVQAVKETLTGTQYCQLTERIGTAWHFTVITKPSETPSTTATDNAIKSQKPGPDTYTFTQTEYPTYGWVRDTYTSWAALQAAYPTYGDLTNAVI